MLPDLALSVKSEDKAWVLVLAKTGDLQPELSSEPLEARLVKLDLMTGSGTRKVLLKGL